MSQTASGAPGATRPVVPIAPGAAPNVLPTSPTAPPIPEQRLFFALINQGALTSQFGAGGQGAVSLVGLPGESYTVTGTLTGLNLAALVKWPAALVKWPAAFVEFTKFAKSFIKILTKFAEVHTAFPSLFLSRHNSGRGSKAPNRLLTLNYEQAWRQVT